MFLPLVRDVLGLIGERLDLGDLSRLAQVNRAAAQWVRGIPRYQRLLKVPKPINYWVFREACLEGEVEILQSILEVVTVDLSMVSSILFLEVCVQGELLVAQWLYSTFPQENFVPHPNDLFELVCLNCHLPVAQWLYSLGKVQPSLHAEFILQEIDDTPLIEWIHSLL